MSRIGRQTIEIPQNTQVDISDEGVVSVKGPKGELSRAFRPLVDFSVEDGILSVSPRKQTKFGRSIWGTYASHVKNMIQGVNEPFEKKLIIEGVGFRAKVEGENLVLSIGFSHPVNMPIPEGLTVSVEKSVITISGVDKDLVGAYASQVRARKKPEPYKGKGIRYENEVIRRKEGKKSA